MRNKKKSSEASSDFYMDQVYAFEKIFMKILPPIYVDSFSNNFKFYFDRLWEGSVNRKGNPVPPIFDVEKIYENTDNADEIIEELENTEWDQIGYDKKLELIRKMDIQALFKSVSRFREKQQRYFCKVNDITQSKFNETIFDMIDWRNEESGHKSSYKFESLDNDSFRIRILDPVKSFAELLLNKNQEKCEKLKEKIEEVEKQVDYPEINIEKIVNNLQLSETDVRESLKELKVYADEQGYIRGEDERVLENRILRLQSSINDDIRPSKSTSEEAEKIDDETYESLKSISKTKLTDEQLNAIVSSYNIIIDSTALLKDEYSKVLMYEIADVLGKLNKKAMIFRRTRKELVEGERKYYEKQMIGIPEEENNYKQYKGAINVLDMLSERNLIVYGSGFAKSQSEKDDIEELLNNYSNKRICLLTPSDDYLNEDVIKKCKQFISLRSIDRRLFVRSKYLNNQSFTTDDNQTDEHVEKKQSNEEYKPLKEEIKNAERVEEDIEIQQQAKETTNVNESKEGDLLTTTNNNEYKLLREIGSGGEGIVYQTQEENVVAKVYYPDKITKDKQDKLKRMIDMNINIKNVAWPIDLLVDEMNNVIGYTMQQVPQGCVELGLSVLKISSDSVRKSLLPKWNRLDMVKCTLAMARIFKILHEKQILMGDINPRNILVNPNNSSEVWFVDCDSYQFDQYNCPVGTPIFTSPRIYNEYGNTPNYATLFRTEEDEQYAMASLFFQVLMAGQSPFASKGENEGGIEEAIKTRKFAYSRVTKEEIPDGPYRMIWQNLLKSIKQFFEEVFIDGKIIDSENWVDQLDSYRYSIRKGWLSSDIFPRKYKSSNPEDFQDFVCEICKKEANMPKEKYQRIISKKHILACNECNIFLNQFKDNYVEAPCDMCGKPVSHIPEIKIVQNMYRNEDQKELILCPKCFHTNKESD